MHAPAQGTRHMHVRYTVPRCTPIVTSVGAVSATGDFDSLGDPEDMSGGIADVQPGGNSLLVATGTTPAASASTKRLIPNSMTTSAASVISVSTSACMAIGIARGTTESPAPGLLRHDVRTSAVPAQVAPAARPWDMARVRAVRLSGQAQTFPNLSVRGRRYSGLGLGPLSSVNMKSRSATL